MNLRDASGTAVIDNPTRDIVYAFRTFRRAPLAALTIVATVALGLGLVAVVFTVYTLFFLRVDAVRSPAELFAVELDVLDPVAYTVSLLVIVASCVMAVSVPAFRAARLDPIATLRKD